MTREEQVTRAKTVFQTVIAKGIVAAAVSLWPVLAAPFLNGILVMVADKIAEHMVTKGEFRVFAKMVDERVDAQTKDFFDRALGLSDAQKSGDQYAIRQAENDLIRAADKFYDLKS